MTPETVMPWNLAGLRAHVRAMNPRLFIEQYLRPLFFGSTSNTGERLCKEFSSSEDFWGDGTIILGEVRLKNFRLTDWFPRAPGVYWSRNAADARTMAMRSPTTDDPLLGRYFSPRSKMGLIEQGGIGCIRLRPKNIDGTECWLATALTATECHQGVPLAIPADVLAKAGVKWGEQVIVEGRVRFLQDAGLDDVASYVHHARPLIVFVDKLSGVKVTKNLDPIIISPVALFESGKSDDRNSHGPLQYTFVQCPAGADSSLDEAGEWIEKYAAKFSGRVITNYDEQRPMFANAPLSYQKLVAKTYDQALITNIYGAVNVRKLDKLVQKSIVHRHGDTNVQNNITVGGAAIINIDSTLNNVQQSIGCATSLSDSQKSDLEKLVVSLRAELDAIKSDHTEEAKAVSDALEKAVATAAKPQAERKKSLLDLSAKGLKDAAELVSDVAQKILTTATLIAKFIAGLH
jgi:hypothetical protein